MVFTDAYNYTKGGALVESYYLVQNGLVNLGIGNAGKGRRCCCSPC